MTTIKEAIDDYLESVHRRTRDQHNFSAQDRLRSVGIDSPAKTTPPRMTTTERSYYNGLAAFQSALRDAGIDPEQTSVGAVREDWVDYLIDFLEDKSAATEKLYLSAASNFYQYLAAYQLADVNLPHLKIIINSRARKIGRRIPSFPREEIEHLIDYAAHLDQKSLQSVPDERGLSEAALLADRKRQRLRNLRDRAYILFLADTGLRCTEACSLTLGDVDFHEGRLLVTGKGDEQALVRISERALFALRDYLAVRKVDDNLTGRKAKTLPLFTRHDRGAHPERQMERIAASTAWDLVKARAVEAVGEEAAALIHPHSFRHYFVTVVLLATDNLEKARRLARHKSITTTQLYAEIDPELDEDYHQIFNQKSSTPKTD